MLHISLQTMESVSSIFSATDDMESCSGLEIEGSSLLPTIEEWL